MAPGRICLFGDHQDYLGLPVIACAIDRRITLTAQSNSENTFNISLPDINSSRVISLSESLAILHPRDYFVSALRVVKRYGCIPNNGYNITITGTIPINAGVSSSSALVVSWVHFLLKTFGSNKPINSQLIAQLAYESEVTEHNEPGGKMDQYTCSIGNMLFIETGDSFNFKTIGYSLEGMILSDSGIAKKTIDILSRTKDLVLESIQCVVEKVPDFVLEDVQMNDTELYLNFIPSALQPYFIAAVKNHVITQKALLEFSKEAFDLEKIGDLMTQHHEVLKNILKITVPRIDAMIDSVMKEGAYGAKIVGSGGGGSIVVLSPAGKEKELCRTLLKAGAKTAYTVSVSEGTLSESHV